MGAVLAGAGAAVAAPAGTVNPGTSNPDLFVWDIPASVHPATVTIDSGFFDDPSGTVNVR